jgi:peptidylprolyl isomerase
MNVLLLLLLLAKPVIVKPDPPADLTTPPADAQKSDDGLITKQLAPGKSSEHPAGTDYVHVDYAVWRAPDGAVIDYTRPGATAFVAMATLLPGMREMFLQMTPGEKRRAWIPESLGAGKIMEGDTYVVDAELIDIVHPPSAPADVAMPAADATVTASGLAYKILTPGTGKSPKRRDTVVVHYSGWTSDGKMFDSSVLRDEPAEFALTAVIPGWTEGLQLMKEGEKTRFWIPSRLAYKNDPAKPLGMLVFDVTLIKVK